MSRVNSPNLTGVPVRSPGLALRDKAKQIRKTNRPRRNNYGTRFPSLASKVRTKTDFIARDGVVARFLLEHILMEKLLPSWQGLHQRKGTSRRLGPVA